MGGLIALVCVTNTTLTVGKASGRLRGNRLISEIIIKPFAPSRGRDINE
jgi:hypothetical protein